MDNLRVREDVRGSNINLPFWPGQTAMGFMALKTNKYFVTIYPIVVFVFCSRSRTEKRKPLSHNSKYFMIYNIMYSFLRLKPESID